jgi:von Hippel-Lindau disease tumor supressor
MRASAVCAVLLFISQTTFALAGVTSDCSTESQSRSVDGSKPTALKFENTSSQPIKLFWLDYQGKRQLYKELMPKENYSVNTFATHPWVAAKSNGNCIGIYTSSFQGGGGIRDGTSKQIMVWIVEESRTAATNSDAPIPPANSSPPVRPTSSEPIRGWLSLRFGMSMDQASSAAASDGAQSIERRSVCDISPNEACDWLAFDTAYFGRPSTVSLYFFRATGLSSISISLHEVSDLDYMFGQLKTELARKYGPGIETNWDNQDQKCNKVIERFLSGGTIRRFEVFQHQKGIGYEISGEDGVVGVALSENGQCAVPGDMAAQMKLSPSDGSRRLEVMYKRRETGNAGRL